MWVNSFRNLAPGRWAKGDAKGEKFRCPLLARNLASPGLKFGGALWAKVLGKKIDNEMFCFFYYDSISRQF